jgi:hypothetical protein
MVTQGRAPSCVCLPMDLPRVFYSAQTRPTPKRILQANELQSKGDRNCLLTRWISFRAETLAVGARLSCELAL